MPFHQPDPSGRGQYAGEKIGHAKGGEYWRTYGRPTKAEKQAVLPATSFWLDAPRDGFTAMCAKRFPSSSQRDSFPALQLWTKD